MVAYTRAHLGYAMTMEKSSIGTDVRYLKRANLGRLLVVATLLGVYVSWRVAHEFLGLVLRYDQFVYSASMPLLLWWVIALARRYVTLSALTLDAGARPRRFWMLAGVVVYAVVFVLDPNKDFLRSAWRATFIVGLLGVFFSRLQIRATGLLVWDHFIPWERIYWFDWDDRGRLRLGVAHDVAWIDTVFVINETIPVPVDKKDAFDVALRRHVVLGVLPVRNGPH